MIRKRAPLRFEFFFNSLVNFVEFLATLRTVCRLTAGIDEFAVMDFAQHSAVVQSELFSRRQLPLAFFTGETGEMVYLISGPPNPVGRLYATSAF